MLSDELLALRTELWKYDEEIRKRKKSRQRLNYFIMALAFLSLAFTFIPFAGTHLLASLAYVPFIILFIVQDLKSNKIMTLVERRHEIELRIVYTQLT